MKFSPEKARAALPRLDLNVRAPLRGVLQDYAAHYGLDRLVQATAATHFVGKLEAYGYDIATQVFLPRTPAKGTLLVLHGYFDHVGLFTHLIQRGLERGYAVVSYDLPGHGLSNGASGDIEEFVHYQEVLHDILQALKPELPGPWVAVGQSTGGAILQHHVLSSLQAGKRPAFERVQLWAPLVRPAQWRKINFGYRLLHRFRSTVPRHFRRSSSDQAFLDFIWHHDPLQHRQVPMGWLGSMIRWDDLMQGMPACRYPISVVQGDQDETVDWRFNVNYVRQHFYVEGYVEVAGAAHHLANEQEALREQCLHALDRYLLK